jgi:hypothetical protein
VSPAGRATRYLRREAVAHIHEDLAHVALKMMERNMGAQVCVEDCELRSG